jgi:L-ascorbate metabolism protein UlaG (beta-lactamase superfamily)
MQLTWYGHAAFLLESDAAPESKRVILDPYRAPDVGTYAPIDDWADIIAVSHENEKYHSFVGGVRGRGKDHAPYVMDGLTLLSQKQPEVTQGIPFTATKVFENEEREGLIAMVGVTVDGIRFLHMGDCGHGLSAEETAACGPVDVLLALAGGPPTLSLPDLVAFIEALKPKIVVPMHFGNDKINLNLRPISDFLALLPQEIPVRSFDASTISLSPADLPAATEVWVLPPAR